MPSVVQSTSAGRTRPRPLALVSGASGGIGFHLARRCALEGFDLMIVADDPQIHAAARELSGTGAMVKALQVDMADSGSIDELLSATDGRPLDALLANTGPGLGHAFLDRAFHDVARLANANVLGTLYLLHQAAGGMRERGQGRILITAPIAAFVPGAFQPVYKGTKAFIDSFSWALRRELRGTGVTMTCLVPGPTEAAFLQAGQADPAVMAKVAVQAMMDGEGDVLADWGTRLQAAMAQEGASTLVLQRSRRAMAPRSLQPH